VDSALSTLFGVERHLSDMSRSDIEADGEPRLGLELAELRADSQYFIGAERLHRKKKRSVPSVSRIKETMSRRALNIAKAVRNLRGRAVANKIDERCRIMFPLCFFLLNIIYWSYYLVIN